MPVFEVQMRELRMRVVSLVADDVEHAKDRAGAGFGDVVDSYLLSYPNREEWVAFQDEPDIDEDEEDDDDEEPIEVPDRHIPEIARIVNARRANRVAIRNAEPEEVEEVIFPEPNGE